MWLCWIELGGRLERGMVAHSRHWRVVRCF
nr:MAG TPA: hypothetical protein [Caudoviricetes sp.]